MDLVDDRGGAGIAGADCSLERLRAVLESLEVGVAWKTAGWHRGLLPFAPGARNLGPERRHRPKLSQGSGGLRPLRGPGAPCAPIDHIAARRLLVRPSPEVGNRG